MKKYSKLWAKNVSGAVWRDRKYFDYWTFVHFLTGVIFGILAVVVSSHNFLSFFVILVGLSLYEGLEVLAGVVENLENVLSDIVIGSIGSVLAIFLLPQILSEQNISGLLGLCIIINLICLFLGWKNYLKRKSVQGGSHKYALYALYFTYICGIIIAGVSLFHWLGISKF